MNSVAMCLLQVLDGVPEEKTAAALTCTGLGREDDEALGSRRAELFGFEESEVD